MKSKFHQEHVEKNPKGMKFPKSRTTTASQMLRIYYVYRYNLKTEHKETDICALMAIALPLCSEVGSRIPERVVRLLPINLIPNTPMLTPVHHIVILSGARVIFVNFPLPQMWDHGRKSCKCK